MHCELWNGGFSCPLSDVHKSKGSNPQIRILTNGDPHKSSVISMSEGEYISNHSKSLHGKSAFNFMVLWLILHFLLFFLQALTWAYYPQDPLFKYSRAFLWLWRRISAVFFSAWSYSVPFFLVNTSNWLPLAASATEVNCNLWRYSTMLTTK